MADEQEDTPQRAPSFVPDEAATAGTEKPAIAPDDAEEDAADGIRDRHVQAPDAFEVDDAIRQRSIDRAAEESD
jgi:hypothetical protein